MSPTGFCRNTYSPLLALTFQVGFDCPPESRSSLSGPSNPGTCAAIHRSSSASAIVPSLTRADRPARRDPCQAGALASPPAPGYLAANRRRPA